MLKSTAEKLQLIDLAQRGASPNIVLPVKSSTNLTGSWNVSFTITGTAAASSKTIALRLEGTTLSFTTTLSQTNFAAASAIATAWQTSLDGAFTTGVYTVTRVGSTITITKNSGTFMDVKYCYSTDSAQKISIVSGDYYETALLLNATAKGSGEPRRIEDGYAVVYDIPNADRSTKVIGTALFTNESGANKTARYKYMWFYPSIGWQTDNGGLLTITSAGTTGTEAVTTNTYLSAIGATKFAVALIDDNAGSNLASCNFSAWATIQS